MLKAISVSKIFASTCALNSVSLSIEKGDIYGIIGLSGAGKSTLLRCLAGLHTPSSGHVLFNGIDLSSLKQKERREFHRKTGMIFQHFNLLTSRTVFDNVAYPLEIANIQGTERQSRVEELLHLVGLEQKAKTFPASLSGGQKQRVGIARALAGRPDILFCDEATSALDPKTTREILDLLKNLQRHFGLTIVLITHDMEVVKRICTKVAILDAGEIVEQGSIQDIFSSPSHPTTQRLIQSSHHDIPVSFIRSPSPDRKLLRLHFQGVSAGKPLISWMASQYKVEANILLGWIDQLQAITIGTLVVELTGEPKSLEDSLQFLSSHAVRWEEVVNELL